MRVSARKTEGNVWPGHAEKKLLWALLQCWCFLRSVSREKNPKTPQKKSENIRQQCKV